jgi:hypothetical protein
MAGPARTAKVAGTSHSRVIHFFIFLYLMRLERDWVLEQASPTLSNWIMAAYAYHLLSSNNVHCQSRKAAQSKNTYLMLPCSSATSETPINTESDNGTLGDAQKSPRSARPPRIGKTCTTEKSRSLQRCSRIANKGVPIQKHLPSSLPSSHGSSLPYTWAAEAANGPNSPTATAASAPTSSTYAMTHERSSYPILNFERQTIAGSQSQPHMALITSLQLSLFTLDLAGQ